MLQDEQETSAGSGRRGDIADRRAEFERLTRQSPRDAEAERAFIESKMQIVQSDPTLSKEDKERALEQLRQRLPP